MTSTSEHSQFTFFAGSRASAKGSECGASIEDPSMAPPPLCGLGSEAKGGDPEPLRVHGCVDDPTDTSAIIVNTFDADAFAMHSQDETSMYPGYGKASTPVAARTPVRGRSPGPQYSDPSRDERRAQYLACQAVNCEGSTMAQAQQPIQASQQNAEAVQKQSTKKTKICGTRLQTKVQVPTHGCKNIN